MTTSTPTLTDRYVWAVLRSLPEAQRADIEKELRASIADAVDARLEAGEPAEAAESAVLLELGEPARLAAGYAGRPLALIGPALYVDYVRLLKLLLVIVLPSAGVGLTIAQFLAGESIGSVAFTVVQVLLAVGVHLCFWVTLLFVILERTGTKAPLTPFALNDLPTLPVVGAPKISDLVATVIFSLATVAAIFWQQLYSFYTDEGGQPIPVLNPGIWPVWVSVFIGLTVLTVLHAIVLYRTGRWNIPLLVGTIVLNVATVALLVGLHLNGLLLNPAFFAEFNAQEVIAPNGIGTVFGVLGLLVIGVWAIVEAVIKTRRTMRATTDESTA